MTFWQILAIVAAVLIGVPMLVAGVTMAYYQQRSKYKHEHLYFHLDVAHSGVVRIDKTKPVDAPDNVFNKMDQDDV